MIIVPNEWLVELLLSSESDQRKVHRVLDGIDAGEAVIALRHHGRLTQRILSAMADPGKRVKRLVLMLYDTSKVRFVEEHEIAGLPGDLERSVSDDDRYLVETAFSVRPCILVTTDGPLHDVLQAFADPELQCLLLDDYLRQR